MLFGSGITQDQDVSKALAAVIAQAKEPLQGKPVHLAILFVHTFFSEEVTAISEAIQKSLDPECLLGCTAGGVIGNDQEVENAPSLSLFVAYLPEARLQPFYTTQKEMEILPQKDLLARLAPSGLGETSSLLLLPDPYTFDIKNFIDLLNNQRENLPIIGGMASGSPSNSLFFGSQIYEEGVVGCFLDGAITVSPIVSQGCRPFGEPYIVTDAEGNLIKTIAGKPSLELFQDLYQKATPEDRALVQQGLLVGMVTNEYKANPDRGDFLIRGIVGVDNNSGILAIADSVETGQTIQFHVRDKGAADEDLKYLLNKVKEREGKAPKGALIFSCNGRGFNLFQTPNHDVAAIHSALGKCPSAGFFCAGEIGPIGSMNYLHGFTASIALFYSSQPSKSS